MHWYREGNRQRSRILYVFRTPGGVRVGRPPLEPEVLRQIETQHPDIAFDWPVIRDNQQVIEPPVEQRRRRPRREDADGAAAAAPAVPAAQAAATPPAPPIPSALQGNTPDEQMAFLGEWYPRMRERIQARTTEPARQEALLALAERLNPAAWTDADQITSGLQQAAEALERLSKVFAKRRRRSRRRSSDARPAEAPPASPASES